MGSSSDSDIAIAFIVIGTIVTTALVFALFYYMLRILVKGPTRGSDCKRRLDGKTVAITGGNSGIGKATALDLARRGARILLLCRNTEKGENAAKSIKDQITSEINLQNHGTRRSGFKVLHNVEDGGENNNHKPDVHVYRLDLGSTSCIRECARNIAKNEAKIDILINNAGVMVTPKNVKTEDGFDMQFGVNHLGHFLLTELLLPLLKSATKAGNKARIVIVSSRSHHKGQIFWKDVNFYKMNYGDGTKAYYQSKLANVMHSKELARRLSGSGINVYCLHPGTVDTKLLRSGYQSSWWGWWVFGPLRLHRPFVKDTFHGAQTSLYCALDGGLDGETNSGRYYANCREARPSGRAMVVKDCKKLWDLSEHYLGLKSSNQSEML